MKKHANVYRVVLALEAIQAVRFLYPHYMGTNQQAEAGIYDYISAPIK